MLATPLYDITVYLYVLLGDQPADRLSGELCTLWEACAIGAATERASEADNPRTDESRWYCFLY